VTFAHIAGVPVEEALLSFAPVGVAGLGALGVALRRCLHRLRRRKGD
jgi:hypothetical protein